MHYGINIRQWYIPSDNNLRITTRGCAPHSSLYRPSLKVTMFNSLVTYNYSRLVLSFVSQANIVECDVLFHNWLQLLFQNKTHYTDVNVILEKTYLWNTMSPSPRVSQGQGHTEAVTDVIWKCLKESNPRNTNYQQKHQLSTLSRHTERQTQYVSKIVQTESISNDQET